MRLLPPSEHSKAHLRDADPAAGAARAAAAADLIRPDFAAQPQLRGALVFEGVTAAGDMLFVPEGWALQTLSLEWSCVLRGVYVDEHTAAVAAAAGMPVGTALGGSGSRDTGDSAVHSRRGLLQGNQVQLRLMLSHIN